jgi:hypothetical protein
VEVLLTTGYLVQTTVFTDAASGPDFDEALGIISSLKALKPEESAAPPGVVSVAGLDLGLKLPAGRFRSWADGLNSNANYFSFRDEKGILLSGWLDHARDFPGMKAHWAKERAALQAKAGVEIKSEMAMRVGEWDAILYVVPLGDGVSQKNIRACRVVGGIWADVHVSRTAQGSTFKELEDAILSLELVPSAGAPPRE